MVLSIILIKLPRWRRAAVLRAQINADVLLKTYQQNYKPINQHLIEISIIIRRCGVNGSKMHTKQKRVANINNRLGGVDSFEEFGF